jgi:hypothetical protein
MLRGTTLKGSHFHYPSPGILVALLRAGQGSDRVSGQSCHGKLIGNSVIIMLRGNTIKVSHLNSPSPGILATLLRAGQGFRQGFWAKL